MSAISSVFELFESKHLVYGYANARVKARKAKILQWENFEDFSNQGKVLAVKGGQVEGHVMPAARFDEVWRMTSREDLVGKIAFLMASPLHRLMRTLQAPLGNVGVLLGELKRTKDT